MFHDDYNNHGRSLRTSLTSGNYHSRSFLEQVPGNDSTPNLTQRRLQQRSTPISYEQQYYSSAQQRTQAGYSQANYQQPFGARYHSGQAYRPYNTPSSSSADPLRFPPLPGGDSDSDASTQNCPCEQCSAARRTQARPPTWYPVEQQDPRRFGDTFTPYPDQGQDVGNRAESAINVPSRVQFVPPQFARVQDNALVHEIAGPPNMGFPRTPTLDASIAESQRRLACRYVNNPDAYVSAIRSESGPSGRLNVVITLEMTNVV